MPVTPAALKACRDFLPQARVAKRRYFGQWCEWDAEGKLIRDKSIGAGCHGAMGRCDTYNPKTYKYEPQAANVMLFIQQQQQTWAPSSVEAFRAFVKYMCQDSAFSVFVVNKDDLDELCDGGIIFDTDASGHKTAYFFAKTLRYTTEDVWRPKIWYELTNKRGVHPMVALVACSILTKDWAMQSIRTHNSTFQNPQTVKQLSQILSKKFECVSRPFENKKLEGDPHNSADFFYSSDEYSWGKLIHSPKSKQEKTPDGWGGFIYKEIPASREDFTNHLKDLTTQALKEIKE